MTYIFSHAGGSIPYLAARFAIIDEMGFIAGGDQRGTAADMFRRIYWDTALAASDPVLHMLRDVGGINQVLYGTDFPYLRRDLAVSSKQRISQSSELDDSERRAILGGNASHLFPRLHSVVPGLSVLNRRTTPQMKYMEASEFRGPDVLTVICAFALSLCMGLECCPIKFNERLTDIPFSALVRHALLHRWN